MRLAPRLRTVAIAAASGAVAGLIVALAGAIGLGDLTLVMPTALVVATAVALHRVTTGRTRRTARITQKTLAGLDAQLRATTTRMKTVERAVHESGAMANLALTADPYPLPLGGNWALAWDAAVILARETGLARPDVVVELGSGGSSVLVGQQLRRTGKGHLYSLDHDPAFAAVTRQHLVAHGLDDWVTVFDAPLRDCVIGNELFQWYDVPLAVRELKRIDLLIVDGPPQATDRAGLPRYPALPAFRDQLPAGAIVFVDDAYREAEQKTLERWQHEEPGWTLKVLKTSRGTALLRRSAADARR